VIPSPENFHDWRPSARQELLLKAALQRGPEAAAALDAWSATLEGEALDAGSQRLLPLLYRNLKDQNIASAMAEKLKPEYLDTWARNQVLLAKLATLLQSLEAAGIPTLVLKGASLITRFYGDRGLRPMNDLDVLVPTSRATEAVSLLCNLGWRPERKLDESFARFLSVNHGMRLWDTANTELDLHWHLLNECLGPHADDEFWKAATPLGIKGAPTWALCATDELFHTCIHGVRWNPVPPVRWVADAYVMLRGGAQIDWERLVGQARDRRLILTLRAGLSYLREHFRAPIPAGILEDLVGLTVSREEALEWRSRLNRPGWTLRTPPFLWAHYPRVARDTGRPPTVFGFLAYLQALWDLDNVWQVPLFAAMRSLERVFRKGSA
jgi:hypothetical protein